MTSDPRRLHVFLLDGSTAAHLLAAIAAHRSRLAANGVRPPDHLLDLGHFVTGAASDGQRSALATSGAHAAPMHPTTDPLLLDYDKAGRQLDVSGRTVRRLVASGDLPAVHVGRQVRITRKTGYRVARRGRWCLPPASAQGEGGGKRGWRINSRPSARPWPA